MDDRKALAPKATKIDAWRRHALLGISVVMLAIGLLLSSYDSAETEFTRGLTLKTGLVLFMLWLALPQLEKLNWYAIVPIALLSIVAISRPQLILVVARVLVPLSPVLFLIWLFWKPKAKT